ncbi:MAG: nucleotidyltransferase family protein [Sphingomonadaceae bacterium]|nr:nucleotidyltransferase family protein [Sphingomonadaceae bacterium]
MTLAAIVLAAGSATRFGSDKLSAALGEEPLIGRAIRAARAAPVGRVIVVAAKGLDIGNWPGEPAVERIEIESDALSTSLKAGIEEAHNADGAFIFLGDMPHIPHDLAAKLTRKLGNTYAAIPRCEGRAGHPVLLSARAFPDIAGLSGDAGAGKLLKHRDDIAWVECSDTGIFLDIDTPEDMERSRRQLG